MILNFCNQGGDVLQTPSKSVGEVVRNKSVKDLTATPSTSCSEFTQLPSSLCNPTIIFWIRTSLFHQSVIKFCNLVSTCMPLSSTFLFPILLLISIRFLKFPRNLQDLLVRFCKIIFNLLLCLLEKNYIFLFHTVGYFSSKGKKKRKKIIQGKYGNYYKNIIAFLLLCIYDSFKSYNGYESKFPN